MISIFLLYFLINIVYGQDSTLHKIINIDIPEIGKLEQDMQSTFYKLTIPQNIAINTMDLVVRIKETESADQGNDDFSDPDVYVSKIELKPNSPEKASWYSERFGEDIVSIPNTVVSGGEIFYIGVFCQKKCNYELSTFLQEEFEIFEGIMYQITIEKNGSRLFKFKSKDSYNELEIIAFTPFISNFKFLVGKNERPSNQKTLQTIPIWLGGMSVNIQKDSPDYCTNCYYYILLVSPIRESQLNFFAKYEETETLVRSTEPIYSAIRPGQKHCYKIAIDEYNKNENIIIQTTLFSGSATLSVKPWSKPDNNSDSYYIPTEKMIKISPQDRKIGNTETGNYHFCLTSTENTSYIAKAFFESDVENAQRFNFLYLDNDLMGYLPKDSVTRFRIVDIMNNSSYTIYIQSKIGEAKLYGYICENIKLCRFSKSKLQEELNKNKMIQSIDSAMDSQYVYINSTDNLCHQKMNYDSLEKEARNLPCATLAIVYCGGSEDCEFSIKAIRNDVVSQRLVQRKPFFGIVAYKETHYFSFHIENPKISKISIILNSINGDANLEVRFEQKKLISVNAGYLPDVIIVTKDNFMKTDLLGKFFIRVIGKTFASYSLVYYTEIEDQITPMLSVELQTGHIIRDLFEASTTKYKVYSYNHKTGKPLDIRITLTAERSEYAIHVFLDLSTLIYKEDETIKIKNSLWNTIYYNELIIRKTDENYQKDAIYYIVIEKKIDSGTSSTNHIPSYWLGVTNEFFPFLLYEGIPHSSTLDERVDYQTYWYTHTNIDNPFSISVNTFYGRVNVYVDFVEIEDFNSDRIPFKILNTDSEYITIPSDKLKSSCIQRNFCSIFFAIKKSSFNDSQYLVVVKSSPSEPEILNPGIMRTDTLLAGETRNYYVMVENTQKNSIIFVSFINGIGEVYFNVPKEIASLKRAEYPTKDKYMYKADDFYLGKIIDLSEDYFKFCNPCIVLVSVIGKYIVMKEDDIDFSISFYDESRKINQNQPLKGFIAQNEIQYFNVHFGKKTENVYVSLTNQNGDVDLFMNYGNQLPKFQNATWSSATPYNEFIQFDKTDGFFVSRNIPNLLGNYTIMLYGVTNSTYTLYISSYPNKIIHVSQSAPASCRAEENEKCFFRFYNEFFEMENEKWYDFVITTDYLVGSGVIFAKLYEKTTYEMLDNFPSSTNNDYSSIKTNSRNLLKIRIDKNNNKLTNDSMILITVQCKQSCFFDLNVARMFNWDIQYLDLYRENLYYIYKKTDTTQTILIYYNWSDKDLNYNVFTYEGSAKFTLYTNDSRSSSPDSKIIKVFSTNYLNKPTYHDFIDNKKYDTSYKGLYFAVEPEEDVGFFLRLSYDTEWNKIKVGQVNTYLIQNEEMKFYGYFDMIDEYEYAIVTVTPHNPKTFAYLFIKYQLIDKNSESKDSYDYVIPDNSNSDFKSNTDPLLSSMSVLVPKNMTEKSDNKYERVLIRIQTMNLSLNSTKVDNKIDIMVSPSVKNLSINSVLPNKYIFTEFTGINTDYKIFDLKRQFPKDEKLIINLSPCEGSVDFRISDKMNFNKEEAQNIAFTEDTNGGKIFISVDLKKFDSNNFYLTLWAKVAEDCNLKDNKFICGNKTSVMFYYYTTTDSYFINSFANKKGKIEIDSTDSNSATIHWSNVLSKDTNNQVYLTDSSYKVFVSDNLFDFKNMGSVCYLSRMKINSNYLVTLNFSNEQVTAKIEGLESNKYFLNVLATISETNENIAYDALEIIVESRQISPIFVVLISILILILLFLVYYFYKKFTATKEILKYEMNDVRNMANVPRPRLESELKDLSRDNTIKYANIAELYQA